MKRLRWLAAPACLAVVSTISLTAQAATTPAPTTLSPAAAAATGGTSQTVTLITGDVVEVLADGTITVRPGPGRDGTKFSIQGRDGHQMVIPRDAMALLSAGLLDQNLFDITTLLQNGYGDADSDTIPLIVRYDTTTARTGARTWVKEHGATVTGEVSSVKALSAHTSKKDAAAWWSDLTTTGKAADNAKAAKAGRAPALAGNLASVSLDGKLAIALDHSTGQINAPTAWQSGLTGRGVKVAVLDTGIDATHPDFAGRIAQTRNFTTESADDVVGHGTHVASTIAGSGAASDGLYKGVAPDADLLIGKVCEVMTCTESAILAGMQWAAEQGADVINMSLGGPDYPGEDVLEQAINQLSDQYGVLFVVAAGNEGQSGASTVSSPGTADAALSVAAVDDNDLVAYFSGRGPRLPDAALKPEIAAPGVDIMAVRSSQTTESDDPPEGEGLTADQYVQKSGTSMATPHVAGAAALLAQ